MPTQPALAAHAVSIGYGRSVIVRDLDLTVEKGSFTALLGPNGSGKSTLLRALARLLPVRSGTVALDGRPIDGLSARQLARRIGVLGQGTVAPEGMTVAELVRQGRYPHRSLFSRWSAADEKACADALAQTGALHLKDRLLESLSGGQRQRAWISMTLAQETDILLLDEPTTYLDLAHQVEVLELMRELAGARGKTVVAVLHDLNLAARYADRIAFLKAGRLVAYGRAEELMNAQTIEDVFGLACSVLVDPFTGKPLCVPALKARAPVADK